MSGFLEFEKFVKDDKDTKEKSFNDGVDRHHKRNILTDISDEPILNDLYNDTSFLTIDLPMHHSRGLHKTSLMADANEQTPIVSPTTKPQTIDSTNPFEITQVKEVSNKNYTPHVFFVKFSNEIPSNIKEDEDVNLFSQNEIDNKFLHKFKVDYVNADEIMKQNTINDVMNDASSSSFKKASSNGVIPCITFCNMSLFRSLTIAELRYIIAYQLAINVSNVRISVRDIESVRNCTNPEVLNDKECVYSHTVNIMNSLNPSTIYEINELTDKTVSIGDSLIKIRIIRNNDNRNNIYEETFYPNYFTTAIYVKKMLMNDKKQKLSSIPFHVSISQMVVSLVYKGPQSSHSGLNIIKLFNMNHINKQCSKIYIHSNQLDNFKHNPRAMQYVKVPLNSTNEFKGINSIYNTCSFYVAMNVVNEGATDSSGLMLHHIDISEELTIDFVFTNTNLTYDYNTLTNMLMSFVEKNKHTIITRFRLNECVYNMQYNTKYYIPIVKSISSNFFVKGCTINDLSNLNEIIQQDVPQNKFATKTSLFMSSYHFYTLAYWYQMMYLKKAHEFLTVNIVYKDIFPTIHCLLNDDGGMTVTINNACSYDNMIFLMSSVIGCIDKITIKDDHKSTTSTKTDGKIDVAAIRANGAKYGKRLLKILTKMDPVLFGPRYVGKKQRSYSGLCHKKKQRPIPITENEYNELMKIPELKQSITRIQNQTFSDQKICLFCADKTFNLCLFKNASFMRIQVYSRMRVS